MLKCDRIRVVQSLIENEGPLHAKTMQKISSTMWHKLEKTALLLYYCS